MDVRTARADDRAAAIAAWEACELTRPWNDPVADFDRALAGPVSTVLVGEVGDRIVATAMVGNDGHRGWVYYVAVLPELQGRGLGAAIMRAAEEWLRAAGVVRVQLMVRTGNEPAAGFYQAIGYDVVPVQVLARWL